MLAVMLTLLPIFSIMLLGAWAEYGRILQKNTSAIINQFVYFFSLPILLFHIMAKVNVPNIAWQPVLAFIVGMTLSQTLGTLMGRIFGNTAKASTMAGFISSFPNAAFMGIPIVLLVFNNSPDASIYAGIAALLPTLNIVYTDTRLAMFGQTKQGFSKTIQHIWKIISHSPPLLGASLGLSISLSGVNLPDFIDISAKMLGSTAAPCSLFCIGMSLMAQLSQWSQSIKDKGKVEKYKSYAMHTSLISIKLLLQPLLVFSLCQVFGASHMATAVMTIIAAMPTAIVCYVIAEKHKTFTEECIVSTVINTLLSCLSIPFIIWLLHYFKSII